MLLAYQETTNCNVSSLLVLTSHYISMFQSSYLTSYCPPFSSKVRVGEHDTKHDGPDCSSGMIKLCNSGVQDFDIEKVIVHENYNDPKLYRNDIALIKLKGEISQNGN